MLTITLTLLIAFALSIAMTPLVRKLAKKYDIIDMPDSNRKLHKAATPLCGGVAVFLATLATVAIVLIGGSKVGIIFAESAMDLVPLFCAALVILVVGVLDDALELRGRQKLAGQLLAVSILVFSGLQINDFEIAGYQVTLGILAIPFTVAWLLAAINALNLLDGADGFASTIGLIISAAVAAIAVERGQWVEAVVAVSMTGALIGFLVFNFPPSSIFLGDAGSMLIGLVVGMLAIYGSTKEATSVALAAPIALMALPFLDTVAAIIRRSMTGRGIAIGDRAHLHHAIMRRGFGPRRLVISAALLTMIPATGAYLNVVTGNQWYSFGSVALLISILIGTRSFGFSELHLIASRTFAFGESLVPRRPSMQNGQAIRERRVGNVHSQHGEQLWNALTRFAEDHELSKVRLSLLGSWMDDGCDVLWEQVQPSSNVENWTTKVPIYTHGRIFGNLEIAATVTGNSGQHILNPLRKLLDSLAPSLDRMVDDAASQGTAMQDGIAKRVLFINRSYWPDCEATGQLLTELCEDLTSTFDVSVLAGQPNHTTGEESFRASGVQRRNGVDIYRVKHCRFGKNTMLGKACNLVSFFVAAVWQSFFIPKHQVVVVETDPFLLAILGGLLKAWRGSRLVIYMQDVYPDVAVAIGKVKQGFVTRFVRKLLMKAYGRADQIVVLGDDMRRRLINNGVNADVIRCIPNWADTDNIYPMKDDNHFRKKHQLQDKFVIMHSGNMGLTQQLEQLLEVAERLQHREDIEFLLVGDGASRKGLEQIAVERNLTNVTFLPYQPREKLALSLSAADMHVVSMHPSISGCLVPSKMYGIMASGTPVLAVVPEDTDLYAIVESEQVGVAVRPDDLQELQAAILRCADGDVDLEEMGTRARKLAESRFDRQHSVDAFADLLGDFLESKHTSPSIKTLVASDSRLLPATN